jgi:predicted esterase
MGVVPPLSFFEQSRRRDYDTTQNTLFDYAGTHHVRILKRFEAPSNYPEGSTSARLLEPERNRIFHLRFYLPKAALISKDEKIRDIVIMFNGLDEVDRFDLYDLLGQQFAEQGVAAVLLPTPHHLNRHTPRGGLKPVPPHEELFRHPLLIYYNYKQSMLESELLIEKLRHQCVNDEDFHFYEAVFDPNLRISILGFSLGGLRALASFLQEPAKYHTCIVFNSGVELALLNTEFLGITKAQWKDFLDKLNQKVEDKNDELEQQKHWKCFSGVFLGGLPFWLKERLKKNSHKLLFILSGGDEIVPPKIGNLEVAGHGLTVFKIAGVGHVPTIDPQWSPWLVRIADVIFNFVSKTGQEIFSHQDIVGEFAKLLKGTSYYATLQRSEEEFGTDDLRELLACLSKEEWVAVLKLYYASMAYYPRFRELLNDLCKWKKRERRIESANSRNGA